MSGLEEVDMETSMIVWHRGPNAQKNKKRITETTIKREVGSTTVEIEVIGVIIAVVVAEEGEEVDIMTNREIMMTRNTRVNVQKDNKSMMMKMMFGLSVRTSRLNIK